MTNQQSKCVAVAGSSVDGSYDMAGGSSPTHLHRQLQQQALDAAASELCSLFPFLIQHCLNNSGAQEQRSIARYILRQFSAELEQYPGTYSFLSLDAPSSSSIPAMSSSGSKVSPRKLKQQHRTERKTFTKKPPKKATAVTTTRVMGSPIKTRRKSSMLMAKAVDDSAGNVCSSSNIGIGTGKKGTTTIKNKAVKPCSKVKRRGKIAGGTGTSPLSSGPSSPRHAVAAKKQASKGAIGGTLYKSKSAMALMSPACWTSGGTGGIGPSAPMKRRPGTMMGSASTTKYPAVKCAALEPLALHSPGSRPSTSCGGLHRTLSNVSDDDSTADMMSGGMASRKFVNLEMLQRLFRAIELTHDNMSAIVLCRVLQGYVKHWKTAVNQRRLRVCTKLDASSHLLRAFRTRLEQHHRASVSSSSISAQLVLDTIARTVLCVAAKDTKFALKFRLNGMLPVLANSVLLLDPETNVVASVSLLRLAARCLRSARNAQLLGRERRFAERFVDTLNTASALLDSIEEQHQLIASSSSTSTTITLPMSISSTISTSTAIGLVAADGEEPEDELLLLQLMAPQWSLDSNSGAAKMARLMECLFFLTKHKRNKTQLLDQRCLPVLKTIFETHFRLRAEHPVHQEIALITLASLRQFAKTKKGREQLMTVRTLDMCEQFIAELASDEQKLATTANGQPKLAVDPGQLVGASSNAQLQDSLCALCLRCLPPQPLPYRLDQFPVRFELPTNTDKSVDIGKKGKQRKSKGEGEGGVQTRHGHPSTDISSQMQSADDEAPSSDEDYGFWPTGDAGDMEADESLMSCGWSGEAKEEEEAAHEEQKHRDEGAEEKKNKLVGNGKQAKATTTLDQYSRQSRAELVANYQKFFAECFAHNASSGFPAVLDENGGKEEEEFSGDDGQAKTNAAAQSHEQVVRRHWAHQSVRSAMPFAKIAFPELLDCGDQQQPSGQLTCSIGGAETQMPRQTSCTNGTVTASPESMRQLIVQKMAAHLRSNLPQQRQQQQNACWKRRMVFDLDALMDWEKRSPPHNLLLDNVDAELLMNTSNKHANIDDTNADGHLHFESRFESGNLWKAVQVAPTEYELVLSPDINQQCPHYQWFHFQVSGMRRGVPYTFEVVNCMKSVSMFSRGMQPLLFSVADAVLHERPGWVRAGTEISYFRNLYAVPGKEQSETNGPSTGMETPRRRTTRLSTKAAAANGANKGIIISGEASHECSPSNADKDKAEGRNFFSLRFTLQFPHDGDICYLAYHYPYTYSRLQCTLERWLLSVAKAVPNRQVHFHRQQLCRTLAGNPVPLLTITSSERPVGNNSGKQLVLLTARVHPGEANSSWIMHGLIQFLLSDHPLANRARELFVFKLIPMLNPDGVINGSHRCSLAGQDLNRVWNDPSPELHPTIYHAKGLIQYATEVLRWPPFVFVDLHGHSRKSNIFMYGNNPEESWHPSDHQKQQQHERQQQLQFSLLPEILDKISDSFSLKDCSFSVTRAKEFSARIATWRQFHLERVYTMESSYWGFDSGPKAGSQITIADLKRMGTELVDGLVQLHEILSPQSICSS